MEVKKRGKKFVVVCTGIEEVMGLEDENFGLCLSCGEESYSCEPDASGYTCDYCDKTSVYGIGELTMMGLLDFNPEQ